jgi:hypothetical protein
LFHYWIALVVVVLVDGVGVVQTLVIVLVVIHLVLDCVLGMHFWLQFGVEYSWVLFLICIVAVIGFIIGIIGWVIIISLGLQITLYTIMICIWDISNKHLIMYKSEYIFII